MPYRMWLNTDSINMVDMMGCEHWVLELIGDLALLDAREAQLDDKQIFETVTDCEKRLRDGLETLKAKEVEIQPLYSSFQESQDALCRLTTYHTTLAFATTSKLLWNLPLRSAKPTESSSPALPCFSESPHAVIAQVINVLNQASKIMSLRGLVWPICIAGSLAKIPQQLQIRAIMDHIAVRGDMSFGNCGSVMRILEYCWRNRMDDCIGTKPWRAAMTSRENFVLLI